MIKSYLKILIGALCLLLGITALILPVVPGAWLIFVGMELLGLTFLLPHPIRWRYHMFKDVMRLRWEERRTRRRRKKHHRAGNH